MLEAIKRYAFKNDTPITNPVKSDFEKIQKEVQEEDGVTYKLNEIQDAYLYLISNGER